MLGFARRVAYSALLQRLAPEAVEAFVLDQLARKREDRRDDEGRCIEEGDGASFIEFVTAYESVERYVNQWIVRIEDVTPVARLVAAAVQSGIPPSPLPCASERPYPLDTATAAAICAH